MKRRFLAAAIFSLGVVLSSSAMAVVITFDDLTTRDNFSSLGINSTYHGFLWGPSLADIPGSSTLGWASATVAAPAVAPPPTPVSGSSYAWNWSSPQALWIDFLSPHDVAGAYFATASSSYGFNASTIQLFGYDGSGALLASSGVLNLTDSFEYLSANFTGVNRLEIRADADPRLFSVDDLDVSPTTNQDTDQVPEPATLSLLALGGLGLLRRRCKR